MAVVYAELTVTPNFEALAYPVIVTVSTNVDGPIYDDDDNQILTGTNRERLNAPGDVATFTLPRTDQDTNPTAFQYTVDLSYRRARPNGTQERVVENSGWFSLTGDANLDDVVAEQYVPPTWMTTATATLQGYVDEGEALLAQQQEIAGLTGEDAAVRALIDDPASQVAEGLSDTYAGYLVESAGVYPARPVSDGVYLFIGATDPAAFMEPQDVWINTAETPPLNESDLVALLGDDTSDLYAAAGEAVVRQALDAVFLAADDLGSLSGAPAVLYFGASGYLRTRAWLLDGSSTEIIGGTLRVPAHWSQMLPTIIWANASAIAGNVRFRTGYLVLDEGVDADATSDTFLSDAIDTAGAQGVLVHTPVTGTPLAVTPGQFIRFSLSRLPTDPADTVDAGDIGVVAVVWERVA